MVSFRYSHWEHISKYTTRKKHLIIKRISPFLLLSLFLTFWFLYALVAGTETAIAAKIILYPFLLINLVFADFAMWNYLAGKKIWLIWMLECIISTMIIYWLL
jgi:O-antigen ligase